MLEIDGDTRPGIKPSTINLRVLAATSAFASKDEARYYLNGVCIEIDEKGATYIATDGHRIISYRDDILPDGKPNQLTGTFIIPTSHCKHFKVGKDDIGYASVFQEFGRLTLAYGFVDIRFLPIEASFVRWRRAIPQEPVNGKLGQFNMLYLAEFQKFATALELPAPFLAANGVDKPALVWFAGRSEVMGCIMPVRFINMVGQQPPPWARGGPDDDVQGDIEDAIDRQVFQEDSKVADIKQARGAKASA